MDSYLKLFVTIVFIVMTFVYGYTIKDKRRRNTVIMLILLVISVVGNKSVYWVLHWDGPCHGQVVDADTGEPIQAAAVAGIWKFEYFHINSHNGFANAKETITDANGKFKLPLTFAFTFWPFSVLNDMDLLVFKPEYDSHPPVIRRKINQPKGKQTSPDGKYRIGKRVKCKEWKECQVRLNKAKTVKERWRASRKCGSSLTAMSINQSKLKVIMEVVKNENRYLEKLERQKIK